jgi:hypothetical protein
MLTRIAKKLTHKGLIRGCCLAIPFEASGCGSAVNQYRPVPVREPVCSPYGPTVTCHMPSGTEVPTIFKLLKATTPGVTHIGPPVTRLQLKFQVMLRPRLPVGWKYKEPLAEDFWYGDLEQTMWCISALAHISFFYSATPQRSLLKKEDRLHWWTCMNTKEAFSRTGACFATSFFSERRCTPGRIRAAARLNHYRPLRCHT